MDISTSSQPTQPATKEEVKTGATTKEDVKTETPTAAPAPRRRSTDSCSDYSDDLVERVRAAKAAAQEQMVAFGDVSEYEIRKIYGQRTDIKYDEPIEPSGSNPDKQQP
jgi:hypothetical protein